MATLYYTHWQKPPTYTMVTWNWRQYNLKDLHFKDLLSVGADRLLYACNDDYRELEVAITDMSHRLIHKLCPPGYRRWTWQLSACIVPSSGNIAVMQNNDHEFSYLDIFSKTGNEH